MVEVDCSELSGETKLIIARAISEGLEGTGIAFLKGDHIAIDTLSGPEIRSDRVQSILQSLVSGWKDASAYSVETPSSGQIVVHTSLPVSPKEKHVVDERLPPGLLHCTVCGYVTTSEDKYRNHLRIHDLIRGM